jgi:predicted HTH transcriptional regulator
VPVSLRGRYYYRSGSVNQELTGAALNGFLLKRAGQTWDDVIEDDDFTIRFQEAEEGNIIQLLDKVFRTLDCKFLIRNISFEGMNRVETLEYPTPALREMILNALIHRNYMGTHTQLRVYDKKLFLWNHGTMPEGITLAELTETHSSFPVIRRSQRLVSKEVT